MGVRSPKFIWAPVYSCIHWLRLRNFPPPPHLGSGYTRGGSQDRRHLFVTPRLFSSVAISFTTKRHKIEFCLILIVTDSRHWTIIWHSPHTLLPCQPPFYECWLPRLKYQRLQTCHENGNERRHYMKCYGANSPLKQISQSFLKHRFCCRRNWFLPLTPSFS